MFKRKHLLVGVSALVAVITATSITLPISSSNNKAIRDSSSDTYNSKVSNLSYGGSYWNVTIQDNIERVFVSAVQNAVSNKYPYEMSNADIQNLLVASYQTIFNGNMKTPSANDFIIVDKLVNNREGWIDLVLTKKGYYDENGVWYQDGYMSTARVRITDFKSARPTPFSITQVTNNGNPVLFEGYPSSMYDQISSFTSTSQYIDLLKNNVLNFNDSNFPSNARISLISTRETVNNQIGKMTLSLSLNGFFLDDTYCTYSNQTINIQGELSFASKNVSSFNSHVINFNSGNENGGVGSAIFGAISAAQFADMLVSGNNKAIDWTRSKILGLINNPASQSKDLISFSNNINDYEIYYDMGSLVLSGKIDSIFVEQNIIRSDFPFSKTTNQIIISGFKKTSNTSVVKNENFPIIDFSNETNDIVVPSKLLNDLKSQINVPWNNNNNIAKKYFNIINPPAELDTFFIKEIDGVADDDTGELKITNLVFSGAWINGSFSDLVVCSPSLAEGDNNPIVFNFPVTQKRNTIILNSIYITTDLYPYEYDLSINKEELANNLLKNAISITPNDITSDDIVVEKKSENNKNGTLTVDVYLKYYFKDDVEVNERGSTNKKDWLHNEVVISGFKLTNPTYVTRNIDYPTNIYPSDILNEVSGLSEYEKVLKFFNIYNLPSVQYQNGNVIKSNFTNFSVVADNLKGTATISFDLLNGYFNDDDASSFSNQKKTFSLDFNLFNNTSPTIINDVYLSNVDQFLPSEFVQLLEQNDANANQILKRAIFENAQGIPNDITPSNFQDWINFKSFKQIDDVNKTFNVTVVISSYFDDSGRLKQNGEFSITVSGNFRDVINTRFIDGREVRVPNVSNVSVSEWDDTKIANFIVDNWQTESLVEGDIPPNFDMRNSLIIRNVKRDSEKGTITVDASLKMYYDNQQLVTNENGYSEKTSIILKNFLSLDPTEIIDTTSKPIIVSVDDFASNISTLWDVEKWKSFIIENALNGGIRNIENEHIGGFKINRVDDKLGMISVSFTLLAYWTKINGETTFVTSDQPEYVKRESTNLWFKGFKTRNSSSFNADTSISYRNQNTTASNFFEEKRNDIVFWQELIFNNVVNISTLPTNENSTNIIINFDKVVIDNQNGEIILQEVKFNHYYGTTFALEKENGAYISQSIPVNQDDLINYPYPKDETTAPTSIIANSPMSQVTLKGFSPITESTSLSQDNTIQYNQSSTLILEGYSAAQIANFLKNPGNAQNDAVINEFKDFIFKNCVLGSKVDISYSDIDFSIGLVNSNNAQLGGTIQITVQLNKYWNENGELIVVDKNDVNNTNKPLEQTYIFYGFAKSENTQVINNGTLNSRDYGFNTLKPSELANILSTTTNPNYNRYTNLIKEKINENFVSGNKKGVVNNAGNIGIAIASNGINESNGTLTLQFSLDQWWQDGLLVKNNKVYSLTIIELAKPQITQISPSINLNDYYYDNTINEYFNVSNMFAQDFHSNGYKDFTTFSDAFIGLLENNTWLVQNLPNNILNIDKTSIVGQVDPTTGNFINVTFSMNATISNGTVQMWQFQTTLYGFKQNPTGATEFYGDKEYPLIDDLLTYVTANDYNASDFYNEVYIKNNSDLITILKQFIFDNVINHNSNLGIEPNNITVDDVVIVLPSDNASPDIFNGTSPITFYLSSYYNEDGVYRSNVSQDQAKQDFMYKNIIITNFQPEQNLYGPTIPINQASIPISPVWTGVDTQDDTLTKITASGVRDNQELFKAWIMQNLYEGNTNGIKFNTLQDANNVIWNFANSVVDDENGTIKITAQLAQYWTNTGYAQNGCNISILVTGFKQVRATTINTNNIFSITSNPRPNTSTSEEVINQITSNKPSDFIRLLNDDVGFREKFLDYLKEWIILNKDKVFSNLPTELQNDNNALREAISFINNTGNPDTSTNPGTIQISIVLSKYVNNTGTTVTGQLTGTLQLSDFLISGVPTYLPLKSVISVIKTTNGDPWFIAKNSLGQYYGDIEANSIVSSNRLVAHAESVVKNIILGTPSTADGQESSNYGSLIGGNKNQGVASRSNIIIDTVTVYNTLGRIDIDYHLNLAWNADDDSKPTNTGLSSKLVLVGFKQISPIAQASEKMTPFIIGGVAGAIVLIAIVIIFLIYYRRRGDIEYQQ